MMIARIPVALVAVVVLAGCTSTAAELPVRTEYSKTSAFHEWKTFRFASDSKTADYTRYPRYEKMVQQALEEELTARGYTRIEDGPPEFRVAFDLIFRGEKTPRVATEGGGADSMAQSYGGSSQKGSLIIKMLDPLSGEILWTGQMSEIKINAIEPQKELKKAVWRVLVEFPPLTG